MQARPWGRRFNGDCPLGGSYIASTSTFYLARPLREEDLDLVREVQCRVQVTVDDQAERRRELPLREGQSAFTALQPEQVLEEGYQRSATARKRVPPGRLRPKLVQQHPKPAVSDSAGHFLVVSIPATCRSSTPMALKVEARWLVSLRGPSRRASATRWCTLIAGGVGAPPAGRTTELGTPVRALATRTPSGDSRRSRFNAERMYFGLSTVSPVESTASVLTPRSVPTAVFGWTVPDRCGQLRR